MRAPDCLAHRYRSQGGKLVDPATAEAGQYTAAAAQGGSSIDGRRVTYTSAKTSRAQKRKHHRRRETLTGNGLRYSLKAFDRLPAVVP